MSYAFYIRINKGGLIDVTGRAAFRIGRTKSKLEPNKIIIEDRTISSIHCTILVCNEPTKLQPSFWVWDGDGTTGSKNKTIVNGTRTLNGASPLESEKGCKLYHGDYILLGRHEIRFIISKEKSSKKNGTI
ncbi:MAG: FHA domain-containing protein [Coleofasciculus chthonoplastes F3-SA18-01]|uniref:FHA domain-containing protein n=1 Tax=Coleofasciculus chthonoplastes TaxID=64178 RepID=UPI0032F0F5B2